MSLCRETVVPKKKPTPIYDAVTTCGVVFGLALIVGYLSLLVASSCRAERLNTCPTGMTVCDGGMP